MREKHTAISSARLIQVRSQLSIFATSIRATVLNGKLATCAIRWLNNWYTASCYTTIGSRARQPVIVGRNSVASGASIWSNRSYPVSASVSRRGRRGYYSDGRNHRSNGDGSGRLNGRTSRWTFRFYFIAFQYKLVSFATFILNNRIFGLAVTHAKTLNSPMVTAKVNPFLGGFVIALGKDDRDTCFLGALIIKQ